jgi:hypothetical protein
MAPPTPWGWNCWRPFCLALSRQNQHVFWVSMRIHWK